MLTEPQQDQNAELQQELPDQAQSNTIDNFKPVFDRKFLQTTITRTDANSGTFRRILDNDNFREAMGAYDVKKVYEQLREAA